MSREHGLTWEIAENCERADEQMASGTTHVLPDRPRLLVRVWRYAAGSVLATAASQLTLVVLYAWSVVGPGAAGVLAFLAGALPNYVLNRRWAWRQQGRVQPVRELLPYVAIVLASAAFAALATALAARLAPHVTDVRGWQVVVVQVVFFGANAVTFVAKFVLFDKWVFARR